MWSKVKLGYYDAGIEMFWLDDTEPNVKTEGLEYACGIAECLLRSKCLCLFSSIPQSLHQRLVRRSRYCGALWPNRWIETFTEGLKKEGVESPVTLTRAGWAVCHNQIERPVPLARSSG